MSDVLEQHDVDTLLDAVSTGDVAESSGARQIFSHCRRDRDQVEIREYDFSRPERISKDQINSLQQLHEAFARSFAVALCGYLRAIVEVQIDEVRQVTFGEFTADLPNPTCFNLIGAEELDGQICLELSPSILYPIINRLLGGTNEAEPTVPRRPMTLIEGRLAETIVQRAVSALSEAWEAIRIINYTLAEVETNPQLVQIVPPGEAVVVISFRIRLGSHSGAMNLGIPFNVIEPLVDDLSAQSWSSAGRRAGRPDWRAAIADRLGDAPLEITGVLAETTITLRELRHLEVGDLLLTERSATEPAVVTVGGNRKFLANLGQHRGRRALQIVRRLTADDRG